MIDLKNDIQDNGLKMDMGLFDSEAMSPTCKVSCTVGCEMGCWLTNSPKHQSQRLEQMME